MGDCFKSTGSTIIDLRYPGDFNKIQMEDGIHVYIQQASQHSVEVKAGKNLLSNIKTEVSNNTLKLRNDNKCNWVRSYKRKIEIYIKTPNLQEIDYSGSGSIYFQNNFNTEKLILNMNNASGNIFVNLTSSLVELKIHSGPADITASGSTSDLVVYNRGMGKIDAQNMVAQKTLAINRDIGKIFVQTLQELKAEIYEDGSIYYKGNPSINLLKSGGGNLYPI